MWARPLCRSMPHSTVVPTRARSRRRAPGSRTATGLLVGRFGQGAVEVGLEPRQRPRAPGLDVAQRTRDDVGLELAVHHRQVGPAELTQYDGTPGQHSCTVLRGRPGTRADYRDRLPDQSRKAPASAAAGRRAGSPACASCRAAPRAASPGCSRSISAGVLTVVKSWSPITRSVGAVMPASCSSDQPCRSALTPTARARNSSKCSGCGDSRSVLLPEVGEVLLPSAFGRRRELRRVGEILVHAVAAER